MILCPSREPAWFSRCCRLAALLLPLAASSLSGATPPPPAAGYALAFSDDFVSLDLSPNSAGNHTWYDGVWFFHNPAPLANISNANSELSLVWTSNQGPSDTSIETLAQSNPSYRAWRYGYFEARMKWDVVIGAWPAFWLTPIETVLGTDFYNGVQEQGEFDIFEGQGDEPHTFFGTIHDWVNGKGTANANNTWKLASSVDFSQYHTYGLLWVPGKVTWYFDDQPLMSAPTPAVVDKQTYLMILGMQEGAAWQYGNLSGVTASSMKMTVDWVHVWQPQAVGTPSATPQTVATNFNTPAAATLSGSDPTQLPLTYAIVASPTNGQISGSAPNVTYAPNAGYSGSDSFTFKVNNGVNDSAPATVSITVNSAPVPPAPRAASVSFVGSDASTRGNWKGIYGADGSLIANDSAHLPAYASVTPGSGTPLYTWSGSTADLRGLLKYQSVFDRVAATYYNWPGFTFDINFSDGQLHRVALYCVDWDSLGRSQTIAITDASNGSTLDSRSMTGFQGGQYLVWNITGHVQVQLKQLSGPNAIVSGLFFDAPGGTLPPAVAVSFNAPSANQTVAGTITLSAAASSAAGIASVQYQVDGANLIPAVSAGPPYLFQWDTTTIANGPHTLKAIATDNGGQQASASVAVNVNNVSTGGATAATFLRKDTTTRGSWKGLYGQDGEIIAYDSSALPAYASVSAFSGALPFIWTITQDLKALQQAHGSARNASTFYASPSFSFDLNLSDGNTHQFAVYLLDWDSGGRTQTVTLRDAATQSVLDSQAATDYSQGVYLVWNVKGHVTVQFSSTAGPNAVASGVFLGPAS